MVRAARCLKPGGTEWDALLVLAKSIVDIDAVSLEYCLSESLCVPVAAYHMMIMQIILYTSLV